MYVIYTQWNISHQKLRILIIYIKVDRTGGYYAEQSKSIRERQLSYDLTPMWNLRNKTEDHRGREEKNKTRQNQRRRQTIRDS